MQTSKRTLLFFLALVLSLALLAGCTQKATLKKTTVTGDQYTLQMPIGYGVSQKMLDSGAGVAANAKFYQYVDRETQAMYMAFYIDFREAMLPITQQLEGYQIDVTDIMTSMLDSMVHQVFMQDDTLELGARPSQQIGGVNGSLFPVTKVSGASARGYLGYSFTPSGNNMAILLYAAPTGAYNAQEYQEFFQGFRWKEAK